ALIEGDTHQRCQVFTNLLTNAFEALDGRGAIAIVAALGVMDADFGRDPQAPIPAVVIDVSDNGPGITADLTDRIFNPFFTTKPQGSGLGLPIVRKIVDAHDGRIDVNSSSETGTRFRITLPIASSSGWFK